MSKCLFLVLILKYFVWYSNATSNNRIVGGTYANEGQFPHHVSLRRNGTHSCGGSIISRNFILTAAHCVGFFNYAEKTYNPFNPYFLTVRLGSNDRFQGGVLMRVVEVIAHEKYANFLNDVALLRLEKPIIFSNSIKSIPLASAKVPAGAKVKISGWGRIKDGGDVPQKLKWNELIAMSHMECKKVFNWDTDSLICLAHKRNDGTCNGDSGGPAMYNGEVVGIANFVLSGCGTSNPDGYANVLYHSDWIKEHSDL